MLHQPYYQYKPTAWATVMQADAQHHSHTAARPSVGPWTFLVPTKRTQLKATQNTKQEELCSTNVNMLAAFK